MISPKLESLKIVCAIDESPDLSFIGEYSETWKEGAIDRKERGDMRHLEYRYFIPEGETEEEREAEYKRMESAQRGNWCMVGVYATATTLLMLDDATGKYSTFRSPGLWGIESDSGKDFLRETANEELSQLKDELVAYGVDVSKWDELVADLHLVDENGREL